MFFNNNFFFVLWVAFSLDGVFRSKKVKFWWWQFIIFVPCVAGTLGITSKKPLFNPKSLVFDQILNFYMEWSRVPTSVFCMCISSFSSTHLWQWEIFVNFNCAFLILLVVEEILSFTDCSCPVVQNKNTFT